MSTDDKLKRQNQEFKDRIDEFYVLHDRLEKCLEKQKENLYLIAENDKKSRWNIEGELRVFKSELKEQTEIMKAIYEATRQGHVGVTWIAGVLAAAVLILVFFISFFK